MWTICCEPGRAACRRHSLASSAEPAQLESLLGNFSLSRWDSERLARDYAICLLTFADRRRRKVGRWSLRQKRLDFGEPAERKATTQFAHSLRGQPRSM
jgi:hypothetical protein